MDVITLYPHNGYDNHVDMGSNFSTPELGYALACFSSAIPVEGGNSY